MIEFIIAAFGAVLLAATTSLGTTPHSESRLTRRTKYAVVQYGVIIGAALMLLPIATIALGFAGTEKHHGTSVPVITMLALYMAGIIVIAKAAEDHIQQKLYERMTTDVRVAHSLDQR